ncbi:MAG: hypothetical protein KAR21_09535 [Spirochaetales bacterium]|nr:hypothetical protein [Spirochaetales bacterium]
MIEVDASLFKFVSDMKTRVDADSEYNIIKFFTNEFKISWLYRRFFHHPFSCPVLKK